MNKKITTVYLDHKVLEIATKYHAFHGYRSVSSLVESLLKRWIWDNMLGEKNEC